MKSRTRACAAGAAAGALLAAMLTAAVDSAHADTEPVPGPGMLAAPAIVGPDDTGMPYPYPVLKTVTLDWAAVGGASGYRVEVGTDRTWSGTADYTADVLFSQATLPLSLPNATYYWRVAALKSGLVGHWSSETGLPHDDATFMKGWRQAPVLNATVTPFFGVPSFSWSPVPEASGYELQMSKDSTFGEQGTATSPSPDTTPSPGTQTQATPQPANLLADCLTARTRYTPQQDVVGKSDSVGPCDFNEAPPATLVFWRVRALDAYVDSSSASSTTPVASEGVSYQGVATTSSKPDLVSGCPHPASQPSPSASASASASATPSASSVVSLSCDPIRPSIKGSWSAVASFTYDGSGSAVAGPSQVATTSLAAEDDNLCAVTNAGSGQAEHARCSDVPTLHWKPVAGAGAYRVVIALDDAFSNIQNEIETPGLQWTPTGSWRDGLYYYAVQPCGANGCGPVTTTPPSFTKVTPRLTGLSTPPVSSEFTFSWGSYRLALKGASGQAETQDAFAYHLQVASADHPYYDAVVENVTSDHPYFTPTHSYGDGTFIYRVQPIDSKGNTLPWSLSTAFTRDATPPKVVSVTPSSGVAVTRTLSVVFSEPVVGVSSSTLTVSPSTSTTVVFLSDHTATITPASRWLPGGTYTIHVSPIVKDLAGNSAVAVGPSVTVSPYVDDPSRAIGYGGTWRTLSSSNALGGSYHGSLPTPTAQTTASMTFIGTGVYVTSCLGPNNGYVDVYVDGVKKARVSTYRSFSGCGVRILSLVGAARGAHTVKVVGIGAHVSSSHGNAVALDAFTVVA